MATLSFRRVLNEKMFRLVYTLQLKKNYSSFTPKRNVRILYFYHMRLTNELVLEIITY